VAGNRAMALVRVTAVARIARGYRGGRDREGAAPGSTVRKIHSCLSTSHRKHPSIEQSILAEMGSHHPPPVAGETMWVMGTAVVRVLL